MSFNKIPLELVEVGMIVCYSQTITNNHKQSQTITDEDIKIFSSISGDTNPVHMDDGYADNTRYKDRIAHGMIIASYFSA